LLTQRGIVSGIKVD
jgi:fructose-bisphosphate aldolase class I